MTRWTKEHSAVVFDKTVEMLKEIKRLREVATRAADLAFFDSDCGGNSCRFATERKGMRTNGGCHCIDTVTMHFKTQQRDGGGLGGFMFRLLKLREALAELEKE